MFVRFLRVCFRIHKSERKERSAFMPRTGVQGGLRKMLRIKCAVLAVGSLLMVVLNAPQAAAQYKSSSKYGTGGVQAPSISGQAPPAAIPPGEMAVPQVSVPAKDAEKFERNPVLSIPGVFAHQWSPAQEIAPEGLIS